MIGRWMALATGMAMLAAPTAGLAQARADTAKANARGDCIYINQLRSNHALGDRSVIFRANVSDFYRLDFAQRCVMLTYPEPKLILTPAGGIGLICHALDLDVQVAEQASDSIPESCITSAWHKMTTAEVAAVPKKDLP